MFYKRTFKKPTHVVSWNWCPEVFSGNTQWRQWTDRWELWVAWYDEK